METPEVSELNVRLAAQVDKLEKRMEAQLDSSVKLFSYALSYWRFSTGMLIGLAVPIVLGICGFYFFKGSAEQKLTQFKKAADEQLEQLVGAEKATVDQAIAQLNKRMADLEERAQIMPERAAVARALTTLTSSDGRAGFEAQDRAIWHNLKDNLEAISPDLFAHLAREFPPVLKVLPLNISDDQFRDSYRGVVRIYTLLLESAPEDVREEIVPLLPPPGTVRGIADRNISKIDGDPDEFRKWAHDLEAAVESAAR